MPTEAEIKASYKAQHDTLSESYYNGSSGLSKEAFDVQHGQIWSNMDAELIREGYRKPSEPRRDLLSEIDDLKAKVAALEVKSGII